MIVFKTKYRPTPRGVKIISKKDRKELVDTLEKLCHNKTGLSLKEILIEITERDYSVKNEFLEQNIEAYINCSAGIGLTLLGKIAERVGFTCVFQVKFPSKDSSLIIEEI